MFFAFAALLVGANVANAAKVTPIEKVLTLLEDLQSQVEEEGREEAETYDQFACFCKDTTQEKSEAITDGQDEIDEQAATLEEKTALEKRLTVEIEELNKEIADLEAEMAEAVEIRQKEKAIYEATAADLAKAISSLEKAIQILQQAKGASGGAALLAVKQTIRKSIALADALGLSPKHQRALSALLQEDPEVPESDYSFHSDDIISTLEDLLKEFTEKKAEVDAEEEKAVAAHNSFMEAKTAAKKAAEDSKETKEGEKQEAIEAIAAAQEALINAQAKLTDDQTYLKDLTAKCELKAREWDQRTQMRAQELSAISQALAILQDRVAPVEVVNKRALLQSGEPKADPAVDAAQDDDVGDLSFLEVSTATRQKVSALLKA